MTVRLGERALHATAREFYATEPRLYATERGLQATVRDTTTAREVPPFRALTIQRAYNFDKGTFHG